jgi:hypothetical protein
LTLDFKLSFIITKLADLDANLWDILNYFLRTQWGNPPTFFLLIIGEKTYRCTRCAKRSLQAQTEKRKKN